MKERLKEARKALHLTQKQVAEPLRVTKNYIYMMETGRLPVTDKFVRDFTRIFHVNEMWLRTGKGEMFDPVEKEQEIAEIASTLLELPDGDVRYRIAKKVLLLDEPYLSAFESFLNTLIEESKD